jgi:hypothetical protein
LFLSAIPSGPEWENDVEKPFNCKKDDQPISSLQRDEVERESCVVDFDTDLIIRFSKYFELIGKINHHVSDEEVYDTYDEVEKIADGKYT